MSSNNKNSENNLQRCRLAIEGSQNAVWDWGIPKSRIHVSPEWWTLIGLDSKKEDISFSEWLTGVHQSDQEALKETFVKLQKNGSSRFKFEYRYMHSSGDILWISSRGQIIRNDEDEPVRLIGINSDISDQKKLNEETAFLAYYDALTTLPNRIYLKERIEQSIYRMSREETYGFTLLFLDLDGFKHVNDTFGHSVGDRLLIMVAERFKECVRTIDTVARVGGDEFIILLNGIVEQDKVDTVATRIVQSLQEKFAIDRNDIFISVSIGVETDIHKEKRADDIIHNADRAMYYAKTAGKSQIQYYDQKTVEKEQHRWFLGNEMHKAIPGNELELQYQPIFNLSTGELYSFEALLRWRHPEKGLIAPREFIPVAEETGIISSITHWVLQQVCSKINSLKYTAGNSILFAVNITARDFLVAEGLNGLLRRVLKETGCDPRRIAVEVTEGAIIKSYEHAMNQLKDLRNFGINIELDDFGSGYSSLSYISNLPLDMIKLDKIFIDSIPGNELSRKLTRSIIDLAHNIDLEVVAEGVENNDQLNELYSWDCDYVQGFIYSHPIPSDDLEQYLENLPQREKDRSQD